MNDFTLKKAELTGECGYCHRADVVYYSVFFACHICDLDCLTFFYEEWNESLLNMKSKKEFE